jgi:hypothetical protein
MVVEEGVIRFPIWSPFKGGFNDKLIMARGVMP